VLAAFGASVAMSLAAANANADPSASDKAMAEALFQHGRSLLSSGNTADACIKLAESQRLDPQIGTLLYLATCHEQQDKTASAFAEFSEALGLLQRSRQVGREQYARERIAALSRRLSWLVITSEERPPDLAIELDGKPFGPGALGTKLPVDPGDHVIEAVAPGRERWREKVSIAAGPKETSVAIPTLTATAAAPPEPAKAPPSAPSDTTDGDRDRARANANETRRPLAGYALGGAGLAALGVGAVFGLMTIGDKSDAEKECAGHYCTQRGLDLYDDAKGTALVSTVAFAVGAAAIGVGVFLLSTNTRRLTARASAVPILRW
jgi:hypothetical protein